MQVEQRLSVAVVQVGARVYQSCGGRGTSENRNLPFDLLGHVVIVRREYREVSPRRARNAEIKGGGNTLVRFGIDLKLHRRPGERFLNNLPRAVRRAIIYDDKLYFGVCLTKDAFDRTGYVLLVVVRGDDDTDDWASHLLRLLTTECRPRSHFASIRRWL